MWIRQQSTSSRTSLDAISSTLSDLQRLIHSQHSHEIRNESADSFGHSSLGLATVQVQGGTLHLDADLRATRAENLDGALHQLFDGVLENSQQGLV